MTAAMFIKGGGRAAEFEEVARALVVHRGNLVEALRSVEADRSASPKLVTVLRAAVEAGGLSAWGGQLEYAELVSGYVQSLAPISVGARLLDMGMRRSPTGKRVLQVQLVGTARQVGRGAPKPVLAMAGAQADVPDAKSAAIVVISSELARGLGDGGAQALAGALRQGVATAIDAGFLAMALDDAATAAASGAMLADLQADVRLAMATVLVEGSRPLWVLGRATALSLSTMLTTGGQPAVPAMTATGGQLFGIPAMVSNSIADDELALIDATALSGDISDLQVDASENAVLDLSDDPAAPDADTVLTSLYQMNLIASRCEARFGVTRHRDAGAYVITGAAYA